MQKQTTPKSLQRKHPGKALEYYQEQYKRCVTEGDSFLSSLYLDEVIQSMLLLSQDEKVSHDTLAHKLKALAREFDLDAEGRERVTLDISIALRKRFPEIYKDTDLEDPGDESSP